MTQGTIAVDTRQQVLVVRQAILTAYTVLRATQDDLGELQPAPDIGADTMVAIAEAVLALTKAKVLVDREFRRECEREAALKRALDADE